MSPGFQDQVDQMMGRLAEHRNQLMETQARLAKETVKVTSKDRAITVVMGTRSDVREIKFNGDRYRSMAPAELGRALVQLLEQARADVHEKVNRAVAPFTGFGDEVRESMLGGTEALKAMNEARKLWPQQGPGGTAFGRRGEDEDETDG
ncbi:YbaB/EbfC family nucleoid-associated protein [Streptomyces pinistramenti]|uniref:YbaB/EbfC family nucleoid-associated protein n=1 Tax=Streptomyces pinistramenti TaxID=2884812 RepID=UPI001D0900C7|nr:YbaB/EbfC family nucleoid-associated protein [Streptomyces pinistramenti]MCB5906110.1 YbaB/EbfC family nucleoid-associated protein [Streptomyces pinistramenti]